MRSQRTISSICVHCEGEIGEVVTGGVLDVRGETMFDKLSYFKTSCDDLRKLLLNEPRGRAAMSAIFLLPACDPRADTGLIISGPEEYAPISGSNTICTVTALVETSMVPMIEPTTIVRLDTAAGFVEATANCKGGKCTSVAFDNVPAFADRLDLEVFVPGMGRIVVDIAFGGMFYVIVDASLLGLSVDNRYGMELIELGERVKAAVKAEYTPIHPENAGLRGISNVMITGPMRQEGSFKVSKSTVIVPPGRLDRSPCGTGTCARLAILHARGQLKEGEMFKHRSIIDTEFLAHIRQTTQIGGRSAICPTVEGRAWIFGYKQAVLDPTDPFPQGFRVGDHWGPSLAPRIVNGS